MKVATWKYFRINQVFGTKWVAATVHSLQPAEMTERDKSTASVRRELRGTKITIGSVLLNARVALCKILLIMPDFHGTEPAAYALFTELIKAQRCIFVVSKILFNTFYNQQINTFNNMGKYGQLFLIMLQSLRMFIFQKLFK